MNQKTMKEIQSQTEYLLNKRLMKRRWALGVAALAVLVAGSVGVGLRYVGQAMNHTTTEMVCEVVGSDTLAHQHNEYCFNATGELICTLEEREEHVHTDECYETECILICGFEESQDSADDVKADGELAEGETEEATEENVAEAANQHIHTPECYEYKKTLICDKVETTEAHIHGDGCVVTRELTDAEKAMLDKSVKELDPEKEYTKTYKDDKYIITATYMGTAGISEKAELRVTEVEATAQSEELQNIADEIKSQMGEAENDDIVVSLNNVVSLDIGFWMGDVEIEPLSEVSVKIQFLDEDTQTEMSKEELAVVHEGADATELVEMTEMDEDNSLEFSATSFSIYTTSTVEVRNYSPSEGQYGNYYFGYNREKNAFVYNEKYSKYRYCDGALGDVASFFHIVAFDTFRSDVDLNGNILAKKAGVSKDDWGTRSNNGGIDEVSYIQELLTANSSLGIRPERENKGKSHVLVVGSSVPVSSVNNRDIAVAGRVIENNSNNATEIIKDADTANAPFIDLNEVYKDVVSKSNYYASVAANKKNTDNLIYNFDDQNNRYICITDSESAGYINLSADELSKLTSNPLYLCGFDRNKQGSLIINVDCQQKDYVFVPTQVYPYVGTKITTDKNGNQVVQSNNRGEKIQAGETTDFSAGKILWNFYNFMTDESGRTYTIDGDGNKVPYTTICSSKYMVNGVEKTSGITEVFGSFLAPDAYVHMGQVNGQVIATKILHDGAESHRVDFTGTTVPVNAMFHATKTLDGSNLVNEKFNFNLYKWDNEKWSLVETVTNNGEEILFKDIVFKSEDKGKTYWYKMTEVDDSKTNSDHKRYVFDSSCYVIEVTVGSDEVSSKYKPKTTIYKFEDESKVSFEGGELRYDGKKVEGAQFSVADKAMTFNNSSKQRFFVEKQWQDDKGEELTENLPTSIKVSLWRYLLDENGNRVKEEHVVGSDRTLTAAQQWKTDWSGLDVVNASGSKYYYYVKEECPDGFDLLNQDQLAGAGDKSSNPYVLINKKKPAPTSITINKTFWLEDEDGNKIQITDPLTAEDTDPEVQVRVFFYTATDGWRAINKDYFPTGDYKVTYGQSDVKMVEKLGCDFALRPATNWTMKIEGLPSVGPDSKGKICEYKYAIAEKSSNLFAFKYAEPSDPSDPSMYERIEVVPDKSGYTFDIENYMSGLTDAGVQKHWKTADGNDDAIGNGAETDASIEVVLMQRKEDSADSIQIARYRLSIEQYLVQGANKRRTMVQQLDSNGEVVEYTYAVTSEGLWKATVSDLPKYYVEDGKVKTYSYFFEEDESKPYADYKLIESDIVDGVTTLVNQNQQRFELPKTGGSGTLAYRLSRLLSGKAIN